MRDILPLGTAGRAFLLIGLLWAAPISVGAPPEDDIQVILDGLMGLAFDEFVDESYKQILLRSPEEVTSLGLTQAFGIRHDRLDDICNAFVEDTYELKSGVLDVLRTYPRRTLGYEQQISLDSYTWLLEAWETEREFMYHFYPVNHGFSRQNRLFRFFRDEHPMETPDDAEDYIDKMSNPPPAPRRPAGRTTASP